MGIARSGIAGLETKNAPRRGRRAMGLLVAAGVCVAASAVAGWKLADRHAAAPAAVASRAWHGRVASVVRGGAADGDALLVFNAGGQAPLAVGDEVRAGTTIVTDGRTRARLVLDDGSSLVLDRSTRLVLETGPRSVRLEEGALLADVAHVEGAPAATVATAFATTKVLGTKLTVTAAPDRTNVEVVRGEVAVNGTRIEAGQEAVALRDGRVDIAPANDLAQRAAFGEQLVETKEAERDTLASGLGELRARRPGRTDEKDHAVRLASHAVKVRIAGNVARTEIDETFTNDTGDELEGIYRFPLPPGAQIERLALEVDGKLVEGEFVDRAKASAIWRGAIQNAAPKAPKPKEEIVWVPGPWHDPALLEWQRGGRFELRIFPIPKKGSRRVVIAYTETVAPVAGVRRYVYPLPQSSASDLVVDRFSVDAQVLGHDDKLPVRARGYELDRAKDGPAAAVRLSTTRSAFTPSGDLAIEYGLDDAGTDASAWAYAPPAGEAPAKDPTGNAPFVAIALRPKLPHWAESRPRDQVLVVDSGRSMFGERFARARRLAVQMVQEMDRRDRVTVLACDVGCRSLPAGFVAPGATGAHDIDAFLAGIAPDGASDVVGAVRAGTAVKGHEASRDLRVTLLSDGVATAGYRSAAKVTAQVGAAFAEPRAMLVAVPIGADADVGLLGDVARGGGGVVVPYQPGQRLEATSLEILAATYGTALRDVEIVLPPGLRDMAPQALPALRAGSETIVAARLDGADVKGDVVLRGKVGGDAFEARYPIEVHATSDAGNAFVPRLYAAARIADRERGGGDRAELVALSQRFGIPSRETSLLVLESEAMFSAFGIARSARAAAWTGESAAIGALVPATKAKDVGGGGLAALDAYGATEDEGGGAGPEKKAEVADKASGLGSLGAGRALPRPSAAAPAPAATEAPRDEAPAARRARPILPPRREFGEYMKRVWVRRATVTSDGAGAVPGEKLAQARAAVLAAPDERAKHKELAKVLALSGQLDELGEALERWSTRDPLDPDVIAARADLAVRRGDREGGLRILGGSLAASSLAPAEAFGLAQAMGRSYERLGRAEACAFHIAAAELQREPAAIAKAMRCEATSGRSSSWLDGLGEGTRTAVNAALAKTETATPEVATGDVVVSASWTGGADLDLALVEPQGRRAGVVSRLKSVRVENALATDRETLAMSSGEAGSFVVEIARADAQRETGTQSGTVTIRAFGQTQTIPFTLRGARTAVGRVDTRWESTLVPLDEPVITTPPPPTLRPFDRAAATSALGVPLASCARGEVGTGHVTVTFAPSGAASEVVVDDARFAGTSTAQCIEATLGRVTVAPFAGAPARVGRSFTLGVR